MLMNRSFTVKSKDGLLTALGTPCHVSQAFNPANGIHEYPGIEFNALWDTGAVHSIITSRVVEALALKPIRAIRSIFTQGVNGLERVGLCDKPLSSGQNYLPRIDRILKGSR
jgi:hypothetical protein